MPQAWRFMESYAIAPHLIEPPGSIGSVRFSGVLPVVRLKRARELDWTHCRLSARRPGCSCHSICGVYCQNTTDPRRRLVRSQFVVAYALHCCPFKIWRLGQKKQESFYRCPRNHAQIMQRYIRGRGIRLTLAAGLVRRNLRSLMS